jgi:large subunit ribosomal protein L29
VTKSPVAFEELEMNIEDLRTKSIDELKKLVMDWSKEQMNLRFKKASAQLENTSEIRKVRRNIARAKTIMAQKVAEESKAA